MANPTGKGGFQKGPSGNPGGRPAVVAEVRKLFEEYSKEAAEGLLAIANDADAPKAARVSAWNSILDRGLGRPEQSMKIENKEPTAAEAFINILKGLDDPKPDTGKIADKTDEVGDLVH